MKSSQRSQVPPFQVMKVLDRVAELRSEGHDVLSLCAGEPSAGAPDKVNARAAEIHASGEALTYTSSLGIAPLREAISAHYQRWYGLEVPASSIAVTTGSSGGFLASFLAAFDVGDRVAVARPGYPAYRNILSTLGCDVVDIEAGAEVGFQVTVEMLEAAQAEHGSLAGLVLASPNNPTGTMTPPEQLRDISAWCSDHGVRLFSDEIYHGITYPQHAELGQGERGTCAWEFGRESVVVNSFSKYWGMPGWRLGWLLLPDDLLGAVDALSGSVSLCPPTAAQHAAIEAFSSEAYADCDASVHEFARTRQLVLEHQEELGFRDAAPADGAFYFYARPSEKMLERYGDAAGYCQALLEQAHVAVTPGGDFDGAHGNEFIRLSFAAGYETVRKSLDRMKRFQNDA